MCPHCGKKIYINYYDVKAGLDKKDTYDTKCPECKEEVELVPIL
jgi:endogenous inhibitor of DNA gyrase (YacG/DUF329 family)